ncbi:hypothetical protein [Actinophytocola oryzae]|uniref:Uncharacterized protein n=1 Tax=Actinophytocola oryzae TaxID=502181 RepID=A0A4R7VF11_9PSEU|nr:hypothetical protein [Actinophytocola oryzae]TDV47806.1 hypothetical protein CLV71_10941 [Actinophytocola oryzae]
MASDLATRVELVKLARVLGTTPEEVEFAAALPPATIRLVREHAVAALYDEHRAAFERVAMITRVLPTGVNVRIALRAFSPMLSARIASVMPPEKAAELANRMPVEYLTEACVHLDPRSAGPLIHRIEQARVLAVVAALIERGDFITLGRLLDTATLPIVREVSATAPTEALLRIGFYAESDDHLTRAVALLPEERLHRIVRDALTGPRELRSAGLSLMGRLTDEALRGRLAEFVVQAEDEHLTALLRTAVEDGAVRELLLAVSAMGENAQRRVLTLPALSEPHTLGQLVRAVEKHGLWRRMAPIAALMDADLRRRITVETERRTNLR